MGHIDNVRTHQGPNDDVQTIDGEINPQVHYGVEGLVQITPALPSSPLWYEDDYNRADLLYDLEMRAGPQRSGER